jgi:dGTPase
VVRRLINAQVVDLIETSRARIAAAAPSDIDAVRRAEAVLVAFSPPMQLRHQQLKQFLHRHLYRHYRVYRMAAKAGRVVQALFDAYFEDRRLLPEKHYQKARSLEQEHGTSGRARAVADYIAGMTDRYAIAEYARLFDPGQLT